MSISSGNLASVNEFLARGADPFVKDDEGHNALHFAVLHNRKAIVEALRETAYSDELASAANKKGYSPVHIGLKLGLKDIVSVLTSAIQLQPNNIKDPHGNNYIHLAASSGDWKVLTAFLELSNANKLLNETNNYGATPLHYASKNGHSHCIELLLNSGAMVHKSHKGVSPLMLACRDGHVECVKLLYKAHSFQIDWQDDDGETDSTALCCAQRQPIHGTENTGPRRQGRAQRQWEEFPGHRHRQWQRGLWAGSGEPPQMAGVSGRGVPRSGASYAQSREEAAEYCQNCPG